MSSEILPSSDPLALAEPERNIPDFVPVRGYQDFPVVEGLFRQEYIEGLPLIDVRGIQIHFHSYKPNKFRDFEHAAIGKEGVLGARPEPCDTRRASCCVHWIRFVVTHPDVEIFHLPSRSADVPSDQERDIYRWKGQQGPGQIFHYYQVVVTRYLNAPEKTYFLTAYPLDLLKYSSIAKRHAKVYPSRPLKGGQNTPVATLESTVENELTLQTDDAAVHLMEDTMGQADMATTALTPANPISRKDRKRLRKQGPTS